MPSTPEETQRALAHHHAGRLDEAKAIYERLLRADPDQHEILHRLGLIAYQEGKHDLAVQYIGRAMKLKPGNAEYHNNYASACRMLGKLSEALTHYREALAENPTYITAHKNLSETLNNLGTRLSDQGKSEEAIQHYKEALLLSPTSGAIFYNMGNALRDQGKLSDAILCFRKALSLKRNFPEGYNNLANALRESGDVAEAGTLYRQALRLNPGYAEAHRNLGAMLQDQGELDEAALHYEQALALKPNDGLRILQASMMPIIARSKAHYLEARQHFKNQLADLLKQNLSLADPVREICATHFYLAYQACNDSGIQRAIGQLYLEACPSLSFVAPHCRPDQILPQTGRIRVGFVSRYFHDHTVGKLMRGLIAMLSRRDFSVTVFTFPTKPDQITEFIAGHSDCTVVLPTVLDAARNLIAQEQLDILVFPDLGMDPLTYFLAFSRLAPAQCVTWGHPVTTGLRTIDYFISSELLEPDRAEQHYTEQLVRLKEVLPTYYYSPRVSNFPAYRRDFSLDDDKTVYLCPQSLFKLHPDFDSIISGILQADRRGEVILVDGNHRRWNTLLMERFQRSIPGVVNRIRFLPRQSGADFLRLMSLADVILDPVHWSGGNTTYEALSLGIPIVTMPGKFMRGRVTYACYRRMGMLACVTHNSNEYIECAVRLGTDKAYRNSVKNEILARNHVLFEDDSVIKEYERFFVRAVNVARKTLGSTPAAI